MITLNQIASKVIRRLSGGNQSKDSTIDRREVIVAIRNAMNQMLKLELLQKRGQAGDKTLPAQYIATYESLVIVKDTTQEKYTTTIPDSFLSLPYNRGVHVVHKFGEPRTQFIRRNQPYVSNFIRASKLQGNQGYSVEGNKIVWDQPFTSNLRKSDKVTVKLVIAAPENIGIDDALPILPEQTGEIENMAMQAIDVTRIPEDRVSDETEIQATQ